MMIYGSFFRSFVASRVTDKITPITDNLVVCRSGSSADTQNIADIVKYYIEFYSVSEGEPVSVYRSTQIFRQFLYRYRDDMTASVIVAGYDDKMGGQVRFCVSNDFTRKFLDLCASTWWFCYSSTFYCIW